MADEQEVRSDAGTFVDIVRKLSPAAFKGFDAACDTIVPALAAISDPRARGLATALSTACAFRKALKRKR